MRGATGSWRRASSCSRRRDRRGMVDAGEPGSANPHAIQAFTGITEAMVAEAPPFARVADAIASRMRAAVRRAQRALRLRFPARGVPAPGKAFPRAGSVHRAALARVDTRRARPRPRRGHDTPRPQLRSAPPRARRRARGGGIPRNRAGALAGRDARPGGRAADLRPAAAAALDPGLRTNCRKARASTASTARTTRCCTSARRNLATRVLAHFSAPHSKVDGEIARRVRRLEWIETAGEFGALLTEARLIKSRRPMFNRRPRGADALWGIHLRENGAIRLPGSANWTHSTIPAPATGSSGAPWTPSAHSKGCRAPTSSARNGWASNRGRAPVSASSSVVVAASASARSRPRSTPCA